MLLFSDGIMKWNVTVWRSIEQQLETKGIQVLLQNPGLKMNDGGHQSWNSTSEVPGFKKESRMN